MTFFAERLFKHSAVFQKAFPDRADVFVFELVFRLFEIENGLFDKLVFRLKFL